MRFLFLFIFVFICIFPAWQIEASASFVSMSSNLSFLVVVLVLNLMLFFSCFVPCPRQSMGFPVVSLLGGFSSGPVTEVISEGRPP